MAAPETSRRFNVRLERLPTPTEARGVYSQVAVGVLKGDPVFEHMDEIGKEHITDDTSYIIAITLYKYGGRLLRTSPDVAWKSLNQSYARIKANESAFGRFRKTLGNAAEGVYKTAFAMLEANVDTREALAQVGSPQPDSLRGFRSNNFLSTRNGAGGIVDIGMEPPLSSDLTELTRLIIPK
jgi:hypothetical protein